MQLLPPSPQTHTRDPQERTGQPTISPRGKLRHSTASDNQVEGGGPRQPHRPPALSTLGCWWDTLPPPNGICWAQTWQHHSGHPHSLPHPKAPAVTWGADEVDQSSAGRILPCSPSPQRPQSHRHRCQHSILLTKAPPPQQTPVPLPLNHSLPREAKQPSEIPAASSCPKLPPPCQPRAHAGRIRDAPHHPTIQPWVPSLGAARAGGRGP